MYCKSHQYGNGLGAMDIRAISEIVFHPPVVPPNSASNWLSLNTKISVPSLKTAPMLDLRLLVHRPDPSLQCFPLEGMTQR